MLYVNAYLVSQQRGGPEEGGWYYDVGTPLASIPIPAIQEPGKSYYVNRQKTRGQEKIAIVVHTCHYCDGTGEVKQEHEEGDETYSYTVPCHECRFIPADLEMTTALMAGLEKLFKDQAGRYERISVCLSKEFAKPYPSRRPTYE